nr:MAG TPA: hypothetical protein [Caudoviricetes sp.]
MRVPFVVKNGCVSSWHTHRTVILNCFQPY